MQDNSNKKLKAFGRENTCSDSSFNSLQKDFNVYISCAIYNEKLQ